MGGCHELGYTDLNDGIAARIVALHTLCKD
jgi:hypothetical protein